MLPDLLPEGWLGMGLECSDCSVERQEGGASAVWYFSAPPRIYQLDPDGPARRAGLTDGDVLVSIDGVPLTDPDGGRRFGAIRPGQTVAFTVLREGERLEFRVTAIEPPARVSGSSRAIGTSRAPRAGEPAAAPLAPHPRRWSGTVGDVDVQVRGSGSMVVDVRRNGREVEIVTPDGTVLLRERSDR
jgi:membrane-associated protease RseP (regulator of RpoE activity)